MAPFATLRNDPAWRGTDMIHEHYFAELSDSENGVLIYFDNEVIDASNDEEAIGKAVEWGKSQAWGRSDADRQARYQGRP